MGTSFTGGRYCTQLPTAGIPPEACEERADRRARRSSLPSYVRQRTVEHLPDAPQARVPRLRAPTPASVGTPSGASGRFLCEELPDYPPMTPRPKRSITTAPRPETPTQIHALKSKTLGPYPLPASSLLTCRKARYPTTENPAAKNKAGAFMPLTLVGEWGALVLVMGGQVAVGVRCS